MKKTSKNTNKKNCCTKKTKKRNENKELQETLVNLKECIAATTVLIEVGQTIVKILSEDSKKKKKK